MRAQLGVSQASGAPVATAVRVRQLPHADAREQAVRRRPERRAPRVAVQRPIRRGPAAARRQRRAGQLDGGAPQPDARSSARAPRVSAAAGSSGARSRKRGRGRYTPRRVAHRDDP